jgi:serine/threonine protein kinase
MELMDGDLSSLIKDPSIEWSPSDLKFMIYQIVRGLSFIHRVRHFLKKFSHLSVQSSSS